MTAPTLDMPTITQTDTLVGKVIARSGNGKTGPIPVTSRGQWSCPTSCPFMGSGCYGENRGANPATLFEIAERSEGGWTADSLAKGMRQSGRPGKGMRRQFPLVRDREVGDVLDADGNIDRPWMTMVRDAARIVGRTVFGYTHVAEVTSEDVPDGYVMNASCETPEQVRAAWSRGLPAVMVGEANDIRPTFADARIVACPAETSAVTCSECGLCAKASRMEFPESAPVIVFSPNGRQARKVRSALATLNA
jgi:hypothetical protein